jgi:hypothetical protein
MSNVNKSAARVALLAGSAPSGAVSKLHWHTYYYLVWVAQGEADSQEDFDLHTRAQEFMERGLGWDYLGPIVDLCED